MLRNRNFILLWVAQVISAAGDTFTFLAITLRIDDLYSDPGASAQAISMVLIAYAVPTLILGIFAGTLVDRLDRKWVMVVSDLARALIAPVYLLLNSTANLPIAVGTALLMASFGVFFYPARTALLPMLVDDDELMSANGYMQFGNTIARLAGPILAGVVVGYFGTDIAFWVDSASYVISAICVTGIIGVATRTFGPEVRSSTTRQDLLEGVRFAFSSRLVIGVTLGIGVAMLGLGAVNVLFVPFLRDAFGVTPEGLGGVQAAQGLGMLIGAVLMGGLGKRLSPLSVSVLSMTILGLGVAYFGWAPAFGVIVALMPLIGSSIPPINASLNTMLQRGVPKALLGRAGSVMDMAISFTNLLSMGAAGWIGGQIGLRETFSLSGTFILVGGIAMGLILRADTEVESERAHQEITLDTSKLDVPVGD